MTNPFDLYAQNAKNNNFRDRKDSQASAYSTHPSENASASSVNPNEEHDLLLFDVVHQSQPGTDSWGQSKLGLQDQSKQTSQWSTESTTTTSMYASGSSHSMPSMPRVDNGNEKWNLLRPRSKSSRNLHSSSEPTGKAKRNSKESIYASSLDESPIYSTYKSQSRAPSKIRTGSTESMYASHSSQLSLSEYTASSADQQFQWGNNKPRSATSSQPQNESRLKRAQSDSPYSTRHPLSTVPPSPEQQHQWRPLTSPSEKTRSPNNRPSSESQWEKLSTEDSGLPPSCVPNQCQPRQPLPQSAHASNGSCSSVNATDQYRWGSTASQNTHVFNDNQPSIDTAYKDQEANPLLRDMQSENTQTSPVQQAYSIDTSPTELEQVAWNTICSSRNSLQKVVIEANNQPDWLMECVDVDQRHAQRYTREEMMALNDPVVSARHQGGIDACKTICMHIVMADNGNRIRTDWDAPQRPRNNSSRTNIFSVENTHGTSEKVLVYVPIREPKKQPENMDNDGFNHCVSAGPGGTTILCLKCKSYIVN